MTLDGFLTFLTLAAAIYALVPSVAKLRIKLGFPIQVTVAFIAFVFVLYLEFFQLLGQPCPEVLGSACEWLSFSADNSITQPQLAFLVVLVWMGFAWAIHKFSRRGASALPEVSRLVDDLVYEQRFAEVLNLVEPYLPLINKAACRRLPLQRLHDRLAVMKSNDIWLQLRLSGYDWDKIKSDTERSSYLNILRSWFGCFAIFVPAQSQAEKAAEEIARVLFRSGDLISYVAKMRPYFAVSLFRLDMYGKQDFLDAYFSALISDTGSILYQELKQNQNGSSQNGYFFPESNRLLYFLFADARTAKELSVWKPVGDHLLKLLRPNESPDFIAYLNRKAEDFDNDRWQDPLSTGIFFFNLMVTTAARQGVTWHMWLYYFPIIVERLEKIYDTSSPSIDTSDEFPTRTARLIYEAFDILGGWVGLISNLPQDSPHRKIQPGTDGDNGNIPVSAAKALGSCMMTIAMSSRINDEFARYLHEVILRDIVDLSRDGEEGKLRSYFIQSILRGGRNTLDGQYGQRLAEFWPMADHVLRHNADDYETALKDVYPRAFSK